MSSALRIHPEVMTAAQRRTCFRLGPLATREGFSLCGGTALALRYGHRRSVDLDWFAASLPDPLALAGMIGDAGLPFKTGRIARGTLHGTVSGVRVSFLEYPYPVLGRATRWAEAGCRIASVRDLFCMKLAAAAQRGTRKDFVDLFELLRRGGSLAAALKDYREKYGIRDISSVIYGLVWFEDAEREPMPRMLLDVAWGDVKDEIVKAVKRATLPHPLPRGERAG